MYSTLQKWIEELDDEIVIVQSVDINEEIIENMMAFSISELYINSLSSESVIEFVKRCRDLYKSNNNKEPMHFYSWFDEQAGHLRMSAISSKLKKLPFGCKHQNCDLESMINGLPTGNSGLPNETACLNVW